jgi:RNA polymerase sigma factor (sigma-70 family)
MLSPHPAHVREPGRCELPRPRSVRSLDRALAERFRAGKDDAVREVYREYGRLVFSVAYRALGDRGLAEEATQQAFVQAWRAASTFDASRELGPWLATIVRRVAIDIHRREHRRAHDHLDDVDPMEPSLVAAPPDVERAFVGWEVRRAIDELAPEERELVELQHLQGLTHTEIAARMDLPLGTVKSRSFRAHRRLAARLGHLREDPG